MVDMITSRARNDYKVNLFYPGDSVVWMTKYDSKD
jgi:hypothetical protein